MIKRIKGASKLRSTFGAGGTSQSAPVATTKEWDLLQTFDHCTLLCTVVRRGTSSGTAWQTAVVDITAERPEIEDMQQILHNLGGVKRSVALNSQATVLLMPTQAFLERTIEDELFVDDVDKAAEVYARYFLNNRFNTVDSCLFF